MKKILSLFLLLVFSESLSGQKADVIKLDQLNQWLSCKNDTTYVFNFWATWCKPCVKELPAFDSLYESAHNEKIRIVLINLDYIKELDRKVIPFLKKNKVKPDVFLLDETDYNKWIDRVDPSWGGAIPATLIYNCKSKFRKLIEGETDFATLNNLVRTAQKHSIKGK
jgi:thiol-disulfide isomerase/thioredoxin